MFYLSGGTALAEFYIKHRESQDLDFFTDKDFPLALVTGFIEEIKRKMAFEKVVFESLYDRQIFYLTKKGKELRVEFTKYPFKRLGELKIFNNIRVDDKLDIAVNKLFAIFDRNEPKDFVDLYFLLQEFKLEDLTKGLKSKFDFEIEPLTLGAELIKVIKIPAMPKMLRKLTKKDLIIFFEKEVKKLGTDIFL